MPHRSRLGGRRPIGRPRGVSREQATYILGKVLAATDPTIAELRHGYDLGNSDTLERNVDGLIDEGWLRLTKQKRNRSRAQSRVSLGRLAGDVVGLDVGREVLRCGVYRASGDPYVKERLECGMFPRPTAIRGDFDPTARDHAREAISPQDFAELVVVALKACRQRLTTSIHPVGCAIAWPARISIETGEPKPLASLRGWESVGLRDLIQEALTSAGFPPLDVVVVNDADAEAFAETKVGVARGARAALVIKLGNGVGAGIVYDGKPYVGAHGFAGELGHVPVMLNDGDEQRAKTPYGVAPVDRDAICSCGLRGHLEAFVCIGALVERLRPGSTTDTGFYLPVIRALEREVSRLDLAQVMLQTGIILGRVLKGPVAILDPDVVVLRPAFFVSESLVEATERLVDGVKEELREAMLELPDVRLGTPDEEGRWMGAQGAALLAAQRFAYPRVCARQRQEKPSDLQTVDPLPPETTLRVSA